MSSFGILPPEKIVIEYKIIRQNLYDPEGLAGKWYVNFHDINRNSTIGASHGYLAKRYGTTVKEMKDMMKRFNPTFGKSYKGMGYGYQSMYFPNEKTVLKVVDWLYSMEVMKKLTSN